MITADEVRHTAKLARIALTEAEVVKMQEQLGQVLDYVAALAEVDTTGVIEVSQVTGLENVQRPDQAVLIDYQDEILKLAPDARQGYFKVKSIFSK